LSEDSDLKNTIKLEMVFEACRQRERKAMRFGGYVLNFNEVIGLFTEFRIKLSIQII